MRFANLLLPCVLVACARTTPPPAATASQTLAIVGTDYAFIAPDSVDAGITTLTFENRGAKRHEMVLVRLRPEATARAFADSAMRDGRTRALRATGGAVLFADAGKANTVVSVRANFQRGERWALVCQFRDTTTAPKHNTLGMFKVLEVR